VPKDVWAKMASVQHRLSISAHLAATKQPSMPAPDASGSTKFPITLEIVDVLINFKRGNQVRSSQLHSIFIHLKS